MGEALLDFEGKTYRREHDRLRLNAQLARVHALISDGLWRTLQEISDATGDMPQSISARLRDFRKTKWGGHKVERRRRGEAQRGIWEYRLGD